MAEEVEGAEKSEGLLEKEKSLEAFLSRNPDSEIIEVTSDDLPIFAVSKPWGDASLAIILHNDRPALVEALNSVLLPPQFTAIHHPDSSKLEIIWTALKLSDDQQEISGRTFDFQYKGNGHNCSFTRSSDRLLEIAKAFVPVQISETNWRNLRSFKSAATDETSADDPFKSYDEPLSLWITNIDWDLDTVLDLIHQLNFHLQLYDNASPTVVMHPDPDPLSVNPRSRYLWDMFPHKIVAKNLNQNLVSFWSAAHAAASPSEQFLNFFRIIEHVGYHHVEQKTRRLIKKVMSSPHLTSDLDTAANDVIGLIREFRVQEEGARINAVINATITPKLLWKEVCVNSEYFTAPVEFEGGLTVERLANSATDLNDVPAQLVTNFAKCATTIRNALAHGKDKKTGDTILPTRQNSKKLLPWVHLISAVAAEIILYDKID